MMKVWSRHLEGEETPRSVVKSLHLKCRTLKIRPKFYETRLTTYSDRVYFLFKIECGNYMRQGTLYIGDSELKSSVREVRVSFVRNFLEGRLKNHKPRCTCHERWAWHKPNLC